MTAIPRVHRPASEEWRTWRDIRLRSLADAPDAFGSTLERELAFTEADWRLRLEGAVIVLVDDEPVALGGGFRITPGRVQVVAMWVEPAHRGRGLSRLVLDEIVQRSLAEGRALSLDVTRGNGPARTAYEHYGFVATGEVEPLREGSAYVVERMVLPRPAL